MTEENLKKFKNQTQNLRKAVRAINEVWENKDVVIVQLLLQNLAFNSLNCDNYTLESKLEKTKEILEAIKEIANYSENSPVIQWVNEEVQQLYHGYSYLDKSETEFGFDEPIF